MKSIRPELNTPVIVIAERQAEFETVEGALVTHTDFAAWPSRVKDVRDDQVKDVRWNTVVYAFLPDGEQLRRLIAGEPIYIGLLTSGGGPQPILVLVGKEEAAQVYNVAAI